MLTSDIRETVNNHLLTHTLLRIYIYVLIYIIRRNSRNSIFFANISKYCSKYFTIFRKNQNIFHVIASPSFIRIIGLHALNESRQNISQFYH